MGTARKAVPGASERNSGSALIGRSSVRRGLDAPVGGLFGVEMVGASLEETEA